jgi:hypothetical protein
MVAACAPAPTYRPQNRVDVAELLVYRKACWEKEAAQEYWRAMQLRIFRLWEPPSNVPPDQSVQLRLTLGAAGQILSLETIESSNTDLAESAASAIRGAAPFESIPPDAWCLVEFPILARFRNPLADPASLTPEYLGE